MSELAFNANGDSFEVPASVTGWRVRRLKPRGAPELVYGRDGRPLTITIDADVDDLREAVGSVVGRYRLDPINDDGRTVENVPAAYIQVVKAERNAAELAPVIHPPVSETDGLIREAMRLNTELARAVVDRFPEMMTAAAELLRAADGAGLPAREPRAVEQPEEDDEEAAIVGGFDLNALVGQLVPMLIGSLGKKSIKVPDLASTLDWRKAAAAASTDKAATSAPALAAPVAPSEPDVLPAIDGETMAHFIAIQSALKPEEATLAREVAASLSPAALRGWFDELKKLSVPQAVQKLTSRDSRPSCAPRVWSRSASPRQSRSRTTCPSW